MDYRTYLRNYPDTSGRFGDYGGAFFLMSLYLHLLKYQRHIRLSVIRLNLLMSLEEFVKNFKAVQHLSIIVNAYPGILVVLKSI